MSDDIERINEIFRIHDEQHKHSGLAAAERIKKAFPQIKIVIVTSLVDP